MAHDLRDEFPSLELAYDQLKGILKIEAGIYDSLGTKAAFLWAARTALLGMGSLGVRQTNNSTLLLGDIEWLAAGIIFYLIITCAAWWVLLPKRAMNALSGKIVKDDYAILPNDVFMADMITYIVDQSEENQKKLEEYGWAVRIISVGLMLEITCLGVWVSTI